MLLLNKKEEYLEAYEDFKRLKTLDYNLWENYRNLYGSPFLFFFILSIAIIEQSNINK